MNGYIEPEDLEPRVGEYTCDQCGSRIEGGEPMFRLLLCEWEWHPRGGHIVSVPKEEVDSVYLCNSCALFEWQKSHHNELTECGSCGEALVVEVGPETHFLPHYTLTRGEFDEDGHQYDGFFDELSFQEVKALQRQSPDSILCPCCADSIAAEPLDETEHVAVREEFEEMVG